LRTANRAEYCDVDWSFTGPLLVRKTCVDKDSGSGDVAAGVGHELLDKAPEGFVGIIGELTPVGCTVLI
jgi:hypothetical protein